MTLKKVVGVLLGLGVVFATLSGCQKQEGPAEHAGKELDKATEKVGVEVQKAGEKIQEMTKGDKK